MSGLLASLRKLAALGFLLGAASFAHAQQVPQNFAPSTVFGRLGVSSGPGQAIPFATLLAQLNGLNAVIAGPATTVSGHLVTWTDTVGLTVGDSGIAVTGTGTIALGTAGAISVASGKTLTDTSAAGAKLLLGATGGGFAAYAGAPCSTGQAINSLSTAGAATCNSVAAATQTNISAPTAPASTSAFKMQGLAGAITPAVTGNVLITISGTIIDSGGASADVGIIYQISYGTGTAPSNAGNLAGTQTGVQQEYTNSVAVTAADVHQPFSVSVVVTGLTVGTAYWLDLAAESVTNASQVGLSNVSVSAAEL